MSRLMAAVVLASAIMGCTKPATSSSADVVKVDPPKGDPKVTPTPTAATEDDAVKFVEKMGGKVKRDEAKPGKPVVEVDFIGKEIKDADLAQLAPLQELTALNLGNSKTTDAGLKALTVLKKLETLRLGQENKVTEAGEKEFNQVLPKCGIFKKLGTVG